MKCDTCGTEISHFGLCRACHLIEITERKMKKLESELRKYILKIQAIKHYGEKINEGNNGDARKLIDEYIKQEH